MDFALALRRGTVGDGDALQCLPATAAIELMLSAPKMRFLNLEIDGMLDLSGQRIKCSTRFEKCRIAALHSDHAIFERTVRFAGCSIFLWHGAATRFDEDCYLTDCDIRHFVIPSAIVGGDFVTESSALYEANLAGLNTSGNAFFEEVRFAECELDNSQIRGVLSLDGATAQRISATSIDCSRLSAERLTCNRLNLAASKFALGCNLDGAHISDILEFSALSTNGTLSLDGAVVGAMKGHGVRVEFLHCANFVAFGEVDIMHAHLGAVEVSGKLFDDFSLHYSECQASMTLYDLFVYGSADLSRNRILGPLELFCHNSTVFFNGALVLNESHIDATLQLSEINVGGDLLLASIRCHHCFCSNMTVAGGMNLSSASISNILSLSETKCRGQVSLVGARVDTINMSRLSADDGIFVMATEVKGSLFADEIKTRSFNAALVSVALSCTFVHADIKEALVLTRADIGELILESSLRPYAGTFHFPRLVNLRDCRYRALRAAWKSMLQALNSQEAYQASAYRTLELAVRDVGRTDWGDEIFFNGRWRATTLLPLGPSRLGQRFLEWISGYGAAPYRLMVAALALFALLLLVCEVGSTGADPQLHHNSVLIATDILIHGDRANVSARPQFDNPVFQDSAILLRYLIVALFGLWLVYLSGLMKYVGGGRS